ncbi:alpha/beta-hydrolase, partial [Polyplosphaeria fusca]
NQTSIEWGECQLEYIIPVECAKFPVPLDYTDESAGTLTLSLVRARAVKEPFKGSILINPGGPGMSGIEHMQGVADIMLEMTGGQHDVIAWDYRGTGVTLPTVCYTDIAEQITAGALLPPSLGGSDTALGTAWSVQKIYSQRCAESLRDVGEFVGTAATARDMFQIVDALGEDGLLRYWGLSYGTYLGQTAAAMFPDRIGAMVLDGVVNAPDYNAAWEFDNAEVGDVGIKQFAKDCIEAGIQACALAKPNATTASLTTTLYDLIETARYEPIAMGPNSTADYITASKLYISINNALRTAIVTAPSLALWIDSILSNNYTTYSALVSKFSAPAGGSDNTLAIRCSDTIFRSETVDGIRTRVDRLLDLSATSEGFIVGYLTCSQWPFEGKGRYEGDFKAKTKNPILFVGSPLDVRTPVVSAFNASEGFEGSGVLQHNGFGHGVLFSPGRCAIEAVQKYFNDGTLPEEGTQCEQDFGIF